MAKREYWAICVGGGVGRIDYFGTAAQAEEYRADKARWEQAVARRHRAESTCSICVHKMATIEAAEGKVKR